MSFLCMHFVDGVKLGVFTLDGEIPRSRINDRCCYLNHKLCCFNE